MFISHSSFLQFEVTSEAVVEVVARSGVGLQPAETSSLGNQKKKYLNHAQEFIRKKARLG